MRLIYICIYISYFYVTWLNMIMKYFKLLFLIILYFRMTKSINLHKENNHNDI